MNWKLDNIYTSIYSDDFKSDKIKMDELIDTMNSLSHKLKNTAAPSATILESFLNNYIKYQILYSKMSCFTYLVYISTMNTEDLNAFDEISLKDSASSLWINSIASYINKFPQDCLNIFSKKSTLVKNHNFFLKEIMDKSHRLLPPDGEKALSLIRQNGASSWQRYYSDLTSNLKVKLDEDSSKIYSLPGLQNLAFHKDESVRKKAFYKEISSYEAIAPACAQALNGISGEAVNMSKIRNYDSVLEKVLSNSRMDKETLEVMSLAIEENIHIFQKYFKKKAELLGHTSTLPFYDLYAPIKTQPTNLSFPHCEDLIVSCLSSFSEEMGSFAQNIFKEKWVDWEPRSDKGNFGLCVDIFGINQSRIQVNFSEGINDTIVLAHEIGHAYHAHCLRNESILNTEYPTPIAEACSIFAETIMSKTFCEILTPEESMGLLEKNISDSAYYIVDFFGRFIFEKELYTLRETQHLSVDTLNSMMQESMKKVYGENISPDTLHPYMWLNKVGYFFPDNEFLNFPYSFGLLLSKELYKLYTQSPLQFKDNFTRFMANSGKCSVAESLSFLGIDIHSKDFWVDSMKEIEKEIDDFCKL